MISFLKTDLVNFRNKFWVGLMLMVVSTIILFAFPKLSIKIIDEILPNKQFDSLVFVIIILACLYLVSAFCNYFSRIIFFEIMETIGNSLQHKVLKNYRKMKYLVFENINDEDKYSFLLRDVNNIKKIFNDSIISLVKDVFSIVVGIYFMFEIDGSLTISLVLALSFIGSIIVIKSKIIKKWEKRLSQDHGNVIHSAMFPINNFLEVKVHNIFNLIIQKFVYSQSSYIENLIKMFKYKQKLSIAKSLSGNIGVLFVFLYAGYYVLQGRLTLGELIGFNFFFKLVIVSFQNMIAFQIDIQSTLSSINRLKEFFDLEKELCSDGKITDIEEVHTIEYKEVVFSYGEKVKFVLGPINIFLKRNEILAIIGENGSGKTTLIKLLLGIYSNFKGSICINGINLHDYNIYSLRDVIGYVSQDSFLINGSIKENIIFNGNEDIPLLNDIMKICGLEEYIKHLDNNADTFVKNRNAFLSGGYQQRIQIARALYKRPKLLIVDEGTSQLDPIVEQSYKKILLEIKSSGIPIIMITHRMSLAKIADKILFIKDGQIYKNEKEIYHSPSNKLVVDYFNKSMN